MTGLLALVADVAGLMLLAGVSVALWTLRVAVTAAGRRFAAAAVAGAESLVFVLAMGTVLGSLGDPVRIVAYATGVAGGTLVGIAVDRRLSTGRSLVRVVVDGTGEAATDELRRRGWPATRAPASGVRGAVAVLTVVADDRVLPRLVTDLDRVVPGGFHTVEQVREVRPADLPAHMHQPRARHTVRWRPAA